LKIGILTEYRVCDKSVRYVAEENIEPVAPDTEPSEAIMRLAGRHFKRWDGDRHLFVSNVRDEYPDD
jgi:F-box protein 21